MMGQATATTAMKGGETSAPPSPERVLRVEHAVLLLDEVREGVDPITKEPVIQISADVTMEGVMNGAYKPASEVENPLFWRFFDGLPYVPDHPAGEEVVVTANNQIGGYTDRPRLMRRGKRPFVRTRINIYKNRDQGKLALHRIFDLGMDEVSIGFWTTPERMRGSYHDPALNEDVEYVMVDTNMKPDHVATVDMGACSGEMGCGLRREEARRNVQVIGENTEGSMGEPKDPANPVGEGVGHSWGSSSGALPPGLLPGSALHWDAEKQEFTVTSPPFFSEGAVPPHQTPKAPLETAWSFSGSDGDTIIQKGGFSAYKQAHGWFEGTGTPEEKNKYKLPHHKDVGGQIRAVWRGVVAAAVVLQGGRGGLKVPSGDVPGIKRHISSHYKQFDKEPPFDEQGEDARDWLYESEAEALMAAMEAGVAGLDHPWFNRMVRPDAADTWLARLKSLLAGTHNSAGASPQSEPKGDETVCEAHETLEKERDDLKTELAEAKAELSTLTEAREQEERAALVARLVEATGLEGKDLEKALTEAGILDEDGNASMEALKLAVGSLEIAVPRRQAEAVGSLGATGDADIGDTFTVGRPGIDYKIDEFGQVVPVKEE